jgi:hypothetical protein
MIPRLLQQLQQSFESLYRLDPAPNITEFLVLSECDSAEQLLVLVEDQDLFLSIVLDPSLSPKLSRSNLDPDNLHEFCLAVEGVSHFLFMVYCSRQERSVTALEMELQGEVDKFVASLILADRLPTLPSEELPSRLFEAFHLREGLDPQLQHRYQHANALARQYALTLDHHFVRRHRIAAMLLELRQFYRTAFPGKLAYIHRRAA